MAIWKKKEKRGGKTSCLPPRRFSAGLVAALLAFSVPAKVFSEPVVKLRLYPGIQFPLADENYTAGFDMAAALDWRFVPFFGASLQGEYVNLPLRGGSAITVLDGSAGPVFVWRPTSRFSLKADISAGLYQATLADQSISGISFGGRLSAAYHLSPWLNLVIFGSAKQYAYTPEPFFSSVTVGAGVSLDLTELISRKTRVEVKKIEQGMVFPVSYAWYNDNSFASVRVTNNEPNDITMVNVSFFLEQYMSQPKFCGTRTVLKKGESVDIPVTAFFNETMLSLIENINANAKIIVEYRSLGAARRTEIPVEIPIYHRNAMSWDDDRRAASFVSARDPAAQWFSRYVSNLVRSRMRPGINGNIQYALGLFETLNIYGINYVIDPFSSYIELSESSSSLDSLNYPYQTLMYRGGDCDDLSILFCSLMEAAGIETAFITIPGHIYMAFDSGLTEEEARRNFYAPDEFVYHGGRAWVPLEITIPREGFYRAWRVGAKEWRDAAGRGSAVLYPMHDSWQIYPPVSVPGAVSRFVLPAEGQAALAFDRSVDAWIAYEIAPQVRALEGRLARGEDPEVRNALGVLYGRYGMLGKAEEQFVMAARRNNLHGWVNLGNVAFLQQRYEESLGFYYRVLREDPDNSIATLGMARCYYELNDFNSSDTYYADLRRHDSALAGEYAYLGSFFESRGRAYSLADRLSTAPWSYPSAVPEKTPEKVPEVVREEFPAPSLVAQLVAVPVDDFRLDGQPPAEKPESRPVIPVLPALPPSGAGPRREEDPPAADPAPAGNLPPVPPPSAPAIAATTETTPGIAPASVAGQAVSGSPAAAPAPSSVSGVATAAPASETAPASAPAIAAAVSETTPGIAAAAPASETAPASVPGQAVSGSPAAAPAPSSASGIAAAAPAPETVPASVSGQAESVAAASSAPSSASGIAATAPAPETVPASVPGQAESVAAAAPAPSSASGITAAAPASETAPTSVPGQTASGSPAAAPAPSSASGIAAATPASETVPASVPGQTASGSSAAPTPSSASGITAAAPASEIAPASVPGGAPEAASGQAAEKGRGFWGLFAGAAAALIGGIIIFFGHKSYKLKKRGIKYNNSKKDRNRER